MIVLDASALIAFLRDEPGGEEVERRLADGGVCGAANWAEVAQKVARAAGDWELSRTYLRSFGVVVEPVTEADAEAAARLWRAGEALSLGDRLCLALGARLSAEILTTDRAWEGRPGVILVR